MPKSPVGTTSPTRMSMHGLESKAGAKPSTMSTVRNSIGTFGKKMSEKASDAKTSVMSMNVGETFANMSTHLQQSMTYVNTQVKEGIETAKSAADTALTHAVALQDTAQKTLEMASSALGMSANLSKQLGPIAEKYPAGGFLAALKAGADGLASLAPLLEKAQISVKDAGPLLAQLRASYNPTKTPPAGEKMADAVA